MQELEDRLIIDTDISVDTIRKILTHINTYGFQILPEKPEPVAVNGQELELVIDMFLPDDISIDGDMLLEEFHSRHWELVRR